MTFALRRRVFSFSAACVLVAGCGGSPPPTDWPDAMPQTRATTNYKSLHSFSNGSDGKWPAASLIDVDDTLYGTTTDGGTNDDGTVFAITTFGRETVPHSFGAVGSGEGAYPWAPLINVNGTLYGTTEAGGANDKGTVFSIARSGKETVLYSFGSSSGDGKYPFAGLTTVSGTLYGTTRSGGVHCTVSGNCGTVFAITPSGKETVLHSFGGAGDGEFPLANLINVDGMLYGTTGGGGANGDGTVFAITRSGRETVLHSFGGSAGDGGGPQAGLIDVKGTLYGTTNIGGGKGCVPNGCGTVFAITPSGMEAVLYSFGGDSGDGAFPQAGLTNVNGLLYGTTNAGGVQCKSRKRKQGGCGTVFSITTLGAESVLYRFKARFRNDGAHPEAGLVNVKGILYGTTSNGGTFGDGIVFSLKP